MPDTCVPTSTSVTGAIVPVAVTELEMSFLLTVAVTYEILCLVAPPLKAHIATPVTTIMATPMRMIFFLFMVIFTIL